MKKDSLETTQSSDEADATLSSVAHLMPSEIILGTLTGFDAQGQALVDFPENTTGQPLAAITTTPLEQQHTGRRVALLFVKRDMHSPMVVGLIHSPLEDMLESFVSPTATETDDDVHLEVKVDGDSSIEGKKEDGRLVFEAKEEIVLKCGESSLTLTKSGKVLIRGKYLLNHSTGINRIIGGSVEVN